MIINLTTSPYYDDFDPQKNFYRILFKPGVPVQARELTQLQTILQNQIKSFASHIFVDGTRASKENPSALAITNNQHKSLKLTGMSVANINTYLGTYVTGATSNTFGKVEFVFNADTPTIGDPHTVVFRPSKGNGEFISGETVYFYSDIDSAQIKSNIYVGTETLVEDIDISITGTTEQYSEKITSITASTNLKVGDQLYVVDGFGVSPLYVIEVLSATSVRLNDNLATTGTGISLQFKRKGSSATAVLSASSGIYYKKGFFINVESQAIVPQKYAPYPDKKAVIYRYTESTVNYNDDSSLLDPAFGSSNYLAPGADRLKVTLTLDTVDLDADFKADVTDDYVAIAKFIDGKNILNYSAVDTTYSALSDKLAERTYDESGNYSIEPFRLSSAGSTSSGEDNRFFISKGKAYIGGYEIKTSDKTELIVPKARDFETIVETDVNTYFGRYVLINSPKYGLFDPETFTLRDYWEAHNTTNTAAMSSNTRVGYISPKFLKYESGSNTTAVYRFYWFNFEQTSTTSNATSIRSIISVGNDYSNIEGNYGTYANPLFFANIAANAGGLEPISNNLVIFESTQNSRYVFPINNSYVKDVTNINTVYTKLYSNVQMTNGVASITTSSPNKFVGSAGDSLTKYYSQQYYTIIVKKKEDTTTGNPNYFTGAYVDSSTVTLDLDLNKTNMTITHANSLVAAKLDIIATLQTNEETIRTKTLEQNWPVVTDINSNDWITLFYPDITALKNVYKIDSGTNFHGKYLNANTYSAGKYVSYEDRLYKALVTTNEAVSNTNAWSKVSPQSLLLYTLDDGQRDFVYDWGRIKFLGQNAANVGNVVVIVDYFEHGGGTGPFTVNSYANTLYAKIPTYRSPEGAATFNLRDCLDFRPARIKYPITGFTYRTTTVSRPDPLAVPGTQVDLQYYLPRIDRVYVQTTDVKADTAKQTGNKFRLDLGTSSVTPKAPLDKSNRTQQLIATIVSPPYTASSSSAKVIHTNYNRYTMKSIGIISSRLTSLEKRVQRQSIEIAALNNKVFDRGGIQGNVLYTTGIFVEDFSNHNAALITSPYFTATINTNKKECRPSFSGAHHKLSFITDPDVRYRDDLITMLYTEQQITGQIVPTGVPQNIQGNTTIVQSTQINSSGTLQGGGKADSYPNSFSGSGGFATNAVRNLTVRETTEEDSIDYAARVTEIENDVAATAAQAAVTNDDTVVSVSADVLNSHHDRGENQGNAPQNGLDQSSFGVSDDGGRATPFGGATGIGYGGGGGKPGDVLSDAMMAV
jgi:hypothetical protein